MTSVRLLLPQGDTRRWHLALRDRLEMAGTRVTLARAPGAPQPLALRLCDELERLIYGARGSGLCEGVDAPFVESEVESDAILIDLTGAETPAKHAIAPLYDGAPRRCGARRRLARGTNAARRVGARD
ncbi:MAG: hypothetical protein V9G24_00480 [Rhodoblastus sp.]